MIARFRAGRRGKLINIYRMLLNAPPLAESWFNHSNTVRWKTTLSGRLREIVIIRMGHLTNTQYVLRQDVAIADTPRQATTKIADKHMISLYLRGFFVPCLTTPHDPRRHPIAPPRRYPASHVLLRDVCHGQAAQASYPDRHCRPQGPRSPL